MRKRIDWIDIARCFGIFAIYLGHFGGAAGKAFNFVFTHHVDLFFLIAGCMETFNAEKKIGRYIKKKVQTLLIPFWMFSVASIVVRVITENSGVAAVKQMIILVLKGNIRNDFFASGLWFLSCLFIMQILFFMIKKLKNKVLILGICFSLFVFAEKGLDPHPLTDPNWIYNIDSAFYYIVYYAIGYAAFPYILELFELNTVKKKLIFCVSGVVAFIYAAILFAGVDLVNYIPSGEVVAMVLNIARTVLVIWLYFVVARLCEKIAILREIGRDTLFLCGNEYIIKTVIPSFISLFGISITLSNPLATYLYTAMFLLAAHKWLIPAEKALIDSARTALTARQEEKK